MKTLTLNGDRAIATAAFAQFYDSFAWDKETALTAFDYGIEQTLFENLKTEFGAHVFISSNQVMWSDGTATITLSTDASLSPNDTQRSAQITNLSAQNDALELTYSSAGQADVDLIWTPTSLTLTSDGQTASTAWVSAISWANSKASENCPFNNARCASIKSASAAKGAHTVNKLLRLACLISAFIFFVLHLDDIEGIA